MALIKCPECGKDFSDKASACPNCGYPLEYLNKNDKKKETDLQNATSNTRLCISILMLILSPFIMFQSLAAGVATSLGVKSEFPEGNVGLLTAFVLIICGVIGVVTRKSKNTVFLVCFSVFIIFYSILFLPVEYMVYEDLKIWLSLLCLIGLTFLFNALFWRSKLSKSKKVVHVSKTHVSNRKPEDGVKHKEDTIITILAFFVAFIFYVVIAIIRTK